MVKIKGDGSKKYRKTSSLGKANKKMRCKNGEDGKEDQSS